MDKGEIAKEFASKMFGLIGVEAELGMETSDGRTRVNASVDEAGFLIGRDGENLKAFQHILALMVSKKMNELLTPASFVFDINNYQKEREDYLMALAKNAAYQVLENKKPAELEPMSAADRRIIHLTVEKIGGVKSESAGERENRRVIISPES
ncbi:MAG: R3H domain-containing nucleic acid-binding protein [Minisyncoccia bacterium]